MCVRDARTHTHTHHGGTLGKAMALSGTEPRIARFPESRAWNRQNCAARSKKRVEFLVARAFSQRDSRESFAIETLIFIARQADSHESLEFPIRANRVIRVNLANRFAGNHATKVESQ